MDVRHTVTVSTDAAEAAILSVAERAAMAAAEMSRMSSAAASVTMATAKTGAASKAAAEAIGQVGQESGRSAAELARMSARLEDLAATSPVERLALSYKRMTAEIRAAGEATGDLALASKAQAAVDARFAAAIAERNAQTKAGAQAAGTATTATKRMTEATESSTVSSGQAAQAVSTLRSNLVDLFVQIGSGGSPMQALIQQGPQIAQAMAQGGGAVKSLTGALSFLVGPVGLVAAAAVAMGGALLYASKQAEEAEAKVTAAGEAAAKAAESLAKLRDSQRIQTVQAGVVAGTIDKSAIETTQATLQAEAQYADQLNVARARQIAATTKLQALERELGDEYRKNGGIQTSTTAELEARVSAARGQFEAAKSVVGGLNDRVAETAAGIVEWNQYATQAREGVSKVAEAVRATGDRTTALNAALGALVAQADAIAPPVVTATEELDRMRALLDAIRSGGLTLGVDVSGTVDRLQTEIEGREYDLRFAAVQSSIDAMTAQIQTDLDAVLSDVMAGLALDDTIKAAAAMADDVVRRLDEAGARAVRETSAGQAASAVSGGASGVMNAIGQAGAVGAMVKLGYDLVTGIADGVLTEIASIPAEVAKSLGALGPAVVDAVVELLGNGVPAIIESIPKMIDGILLKAIPALVSLLLDPRLYIGIAKSLVLAIVHSIGGVAQFIVRAAGTTWDTVKKGVHNIFSLDWWRKIGKAIGDVIHDILHKPAKKVKKAAKRAGETIAEWWEEGFERGTPYVPRTGLYMLHEGEKVVNRAGTNAETARMAARAGRESVSLGRITVLDIDGTARELRRYLGPKGRGGRLEFA